LAKKETKYGKRLFKGLSHKQGQDFARVINHDASYGNEKNKLYIISILRGKGIKKILKGYKRGRPIFVSLNDFFKIKQLEAV